MLTVVGSLVAAGLAAYVAAALVLARGVIQPRRARPTRVLSTPNESEVVLSETPLTAFEGVIGLLYDDEKRLAVIEPGVHFQDGVMGVRRRLQTKQDLHASTNARACGNIFHPDEVTGVPPVSISVQTSEGEQPAWLFPGTGAQAATWVIHVHGMLAGRDSALRSVWAVAPSGCTSLVVSYPGDGERPNEAPRPSTLGQTEWRAIDDAIAFARARGAARIYLVGWSLGATIALHAADKGSEHESIDGMMLVSPVLHWPSSIRYAMGQNHVPAFLASAAIAMLSSTIGSRLLGLRAPLELRDLLRAPTIPTLIIHSKGDHTSPFAISAELSARSKLVALEEFAYCPHAMEWNSDPERFSRLAQEWVAPRRTQ